LHYNPRKKSNNMPDVVAYTSPHPSPHLNKQARDVGTCL
jgi:hypothetical protein